MATLVLVRHGKSEWNALSLWTGHTDVLLTDEGRAEARNAASALKEIPLDSAYVSDLKRAQQTLDEIKHALGRDDLAGKVDPALKERHYGIYTGKNKWQIAEEVGDEEFKRIRRGWDTPIPGGETLEDVYARVVPYYEQHIKPELQAGKNVLVVSHGNTLRALVKHLEQLSEQQVGDLEIGTGEAHCYEIDPDGVVIGKEVRSRNLARK